MMRRLTEHRARRKHREWVIEEIAPTGPVVRVWRSGPQMYRKPGPPLTAREANDTAQLWRKRGINCRPVNRLMEPEE